MYESGVLDLATRVVRRDAAQCPQNLFSGGLAAPQAGQVEASGVAHSPQNLMPARFSCWHRGHCIPGPPSKPDRERSDGWHEGSLGVRGGQGTRI